MRPARIKKRITKNDDLYPKSWKRESNDDGRELSCIHYQSRSKKYEPSLSSMNMEI
jgi:hypothetical protein